MFAVASQSVPRTVGTPRYTARTTPIGMELGLAFAEACRRDTSTSDRDLRIATMSLVGRLKGEGFPPERVIVAIKEAITRNGGSKFPPCFDNADGTIPEPQAIAYRRVFGWCLDAYYAEPDARP